LAQEYLLEVITQVFPDEFHLHTLDQFLSATARLNPNVNVKAIVIGIMDRLSAYAAREAESESPEEKLRKEEEAVQGLLKKLRLQEAGSAEENKPADPAVTDKNPPIMEANGNEGFREVEDEGFKDGDDTTGPPTDGTKPAETPAEDTTDKGEDKGGDVDKDSKTVDESSAESTEKPPRGIPEDVKLYEIFFKQVLNLVNAQNLPIQDIIALLVSLANLALNIYPDRLEYVDQILSYTHKKVSEMANSADLHSPQCQQYILNLMLAPVKSYASLFTVLALPSYLPLLHTQSYPTRRSVAGVVAQNILKNQTKISTPEHAEGIFELLRVLIREGAQQQAGYPGAQAPRKSRDIETDETVEEQGRLARIVHLLCSDNNDTQFKLLQTARKAFKEGGDRIRYTTPALITSGIKLARRYKLREHYDNEWQTMSAALYKFLHQTVTSIYRVGVPDLCLRLFLFCGQVSDQTEFEEVAYEFFAQAFTVYEEAISDSRAQFQAVCVIANALHSTRNFSKENYDTLITKCAQYGSKLLKKPDQCRAVYLASHLWWAVEIPARSEDERSPLYRDGKRVLECLQRALRVADACMDTAVSVELFVEILNRYVYYFDRQNEAVTVKYLNGLIELIQSNLSSNDSSTTETPRKHFERTLDYIASRDFAGVVLDPK
jgi:vacuolar protein sorting-associated protein 35